MKFWNNHDPARVYLNTEVLIEFRVSDPLCVQSDPLASKSKFEDLSFQSWKPAKTAGNPQGVRLQYLQGGRLQYAKGFKLLEQTQKRTEIECIIAASQGITKFWSRSQAPPLARGQTPDAIVGQRLSRPSGEENNQKRKL